MAQADLLSQDEVDALLHGVDAGVVETETDEPPKEGIQSFDFANQDRIVRGRMPTLEVINERFARQFRVSLFNQMRRTAEISVGGVDMVKFSEYVQRLLVPTSLNMVRVKPLHGTALFVFDPNLVFVLVDCFFGGDGSYHAKIEGRDFTETETRVVHLVLEQAFGDLKDAWSGLMDVDFEFVSSDVNPQFANIVSPSEVVVVSSFHIEMEGGGGDLHVTMPYSMLEPMREMLDAGLQSDRGEIDNRWVNTLRAEIESARVELCSVLTETQIKVRDLLALKPGDVIPVDVPELVVVTAESIPIFRGKLGVSGGSVAIRMVKTIESTA
ncbi:MAG TPA: flagellar motor switch protein FliM [Acidiferrobacteraceae bacterium]|nr:flagellar motor switch protein FliM [Acidiferrobacteraceae bacterium]